MQNAGKSSLINAMRQAAGLGKSRNITTASLPGTTLGVLPYLLSQCLSGVVQQCVPVLQVLLSLSRLTCCRPQSEPWNFGGIIQVPPRTATV